MVCILRPLTRRTRRHNDHHKSFEKLTPALYPESNRNAGPRDNTTLFRSTPHVQSQIPNVFIIIIAVGILCGHR